MQVYLVGGAVRDALLGIGGADKDYVVVGATAAQLKALNFKQVGSGFPVFLHPHTHEEYALARTERKEGQGYKGFICDFGPDVTLEEDLKRRDLTVNAMAQDSDGKLIDPYNGLSDLKAKILRHVSPAFCEDPLRVLRTARFLARFYGQGFKIADETLALMQKMSLSGELAALTPERIFMEIDKALGTDYPQVFFTTLHEIGALRYILPEVENLFGVPGPARWHPEIDSGVHTMMTLKEVSALTSDRATRFAMLVHDIGKALTPKEEWPHHHLHNKLGLAPLQGLCLRLHVPKDYAELASVIVLYHNDFHNLQKLGAEGIVRLFEGLDVYRRPERIMPYLYCCKADFLGRKGFEKMPFPRFDAALQMFNLTLEVRAAKFIRQGLKGREIGEAVHEMRVKLLEDFIKTLPEGTLCDLAPPKVQL